MGVGVVEAFRRDLTDVVAKELTRKPGGVLGLEPMIRPDLAPLDVLEDEHLFGDVGPDDLGDGEVRVIADDPSDQLGVVRFLVEVELRT
jgi:hypothetical protein